MARKQSGSVRQKEEESKSEEVSTLTVAADDVHGNGQNRIEALRDQFIEDISPLPTAASSVPSQPGAFAVDGPRESIHGLQEPTPQESFPGLQEPNTCVAQDALRPSTLDQECGLAEARPVFEMESASTRDLEEAVPVTERTSNRSDRDKSILCNTLVGLTIIFVSVSAVLGLLWADGVFLEQMDQPSIRKPSAFTLSPPLSSEAYLTSLLPEITLLTIQSDLSSPQSQAFQWIVQDPQFNHYGAERILQRFALATFFFSTRPNALFWTRDDGWLDYSVDECQWYLTPHFDMLAWNHVVQDTACNEDGRYVRLWFYNNSLSGTIPHELYLLSRLTSLDLISNPDLGGTLPSSMARMTSLTHIYVFENALSGTLPSELGLMTQLTALYAASQPHLEGSFPLQIWSQLTNLQGIGLGGIHSTGTLPTEIGLLANALSLAIVGTNLTGSIPSEIGALSMLKYLIMRMNHLSGTLPTQLGRLGRLRWMTLQRNCLTGVLPSEIGGLLNLRELVLESNQFTSTIPTELGKLTNLYKIDLSENTWDGTIPKELGNLSLLTYLSLGGGELEGPIPSDLGLLNRLEYLNCSKNDLTGSIPSELGSLEKVKELWIEDNAISGSLPSEFSLLRHTLDHWSLARNNFSQDETWHVLAEEATSGVKSSDDYY